MLCCERDVKVVSRRVLDSRAVWGVGGWFEMRRRRPDAIAAALLPLLGWAGLTLLLVRGRMGGWHGLGGVTSHLRLHECFVAGGIGEMLFDAVHAFV